MKGHQSVFAVLLFGLMFSPAILAQGSSDAALSAADLRARLVELQATVASLQTNLQRLEEDSKPENIARALAGIGSTRPEELREQRQRELRIEIDGVRRQLDLLAGSRVRLESAIQTADNRAYQQSAMGFAGNAVAAQRFPSFDPRWVLIPFVSIVCLLVSRFVVACIRRP